MLEWFVEALYNIEELSFIIYWALISSTISTCYLTLKKKAFFESLFYSMIVAMIGLILFFFCGQLISKLPSNTFCIDALKSIAAVLCFFVFGSPLLIISMLIGTIPGTTTSYLVTRICTDINQQCKNKYQKTS